MNKPHICWLAFPSDGLASYRFRILTPFALLTQEGEVKTTLMNPKFMQDSGGFVKADVYVYHKHIDPDFEYHQAHWIKTVFSPKSKIVFDVCDDHFDREMGAHYKRMCALADIITTTNERFAKRIKEVTGKEAFVCFDPVTSEVGEYRNGDQAVWFGHSSNLDYFLTQLISIPIKDITIYTNAPEGRGDVIQNWNMRSLHYKKYNPGRVEVELKQYDVAILPQNDSKNETKFKSPNRVLDALNAGLTVVTNSEQVYGEFKEFIYLDKDLEIAYKNYLNDPDTSIKVKAGQTYIKKHYNNNIIKEQWKRAFNV